MTSVLIALAEPLVQIGVRVTLDTSTDFEVVGEIDQIDDVVGAVASLDPNILLLDSHYQQQSATLMKQLAAEHPSCKIVVMVDHTDEACTLRSLLTDERSHRPADEALKVLKECCLLALREAAHGCVPKASSPDQLLTALKAVAAGEVWAGPGLAQHWRHWWQKDSDDETAVDRLTAREIEVVGFVVDGFSNAEIARQLGLKEQTIKNHIARIMGKLEVRNRVELALKAVRGHLA